MLLDRAHPAEIGTPGTPLTSRQAALGGIARWADMAMLLTLLCSAAAAVAIGVHYYALTLVLIVVAVLVAAGAAVFAVARGTRLSGLVLTTANVGMVVLHIQLSHGTTEFHFGVFVLLGLLLVYRDWRPLVFAAALFAVHHILFDRLQAFNFPFYCTSSADLARVVLHAVYVVVQTGIEIVLALQLRRAAVEGAELSALVAQVDSGERICLDVEDVAVSVPTAVALKAAIARMATAMSEVRTAAMAVEDAASEIASGSIDLSERTERQAWDVQQTATSMQQIHAAVQSAAQTAGEANALAGETSDAVTQGGDAVGRVVETMDGISASADRIAEITGLIDSIALQTHILSLNASVEAARSGEAGRGFSVVATEVQQLAHRTSTAARQIRTLIGESSACVEQGRQQVAAAHGGMTHIVTKARRVSELIRRISSSTEQQAAGVGHVGEAVAEIDNTTRQNAALVEESAAAAESLKSQASRLNAVVDRFNLSGGWQQAGASR